MAEDQGAQAPQRDAASLVASINDQMMELSDMIAQSPVDQGIKQQMSAQIKGFQDFVEILNQPAGQQPQEQPTGEANVPVEAGGQKVIPAL